MDFLPHQVNVLSLGKLDPETKVRSTINYNFTKLSIYLNTYVAEKRRYEGFIRVVVEPAQREI